MRRAVSTTVGAALLALITLGAVAGEAVRDYPFEQVAENTWVIHGPLGHPSVENQGFMNNPGVVLTSAGAVIVDPGSSVQAGEMVLRMLSEVTDSPVVATFNTHVHGDHWLGNQAVRAAYPEAPIYGHPTMISEVKEWAGEHWVSLMERLTEGFTKGTHVENANHAVNHGDEIMVGDKTFRIHHYGQAHTITDIMIEVVEDGVVFLGDNVTAKRIPNLADGTFQGNIHSLEEVLKSGAKTWIPGHGPSGGISTVTIYKDYLSAIYQVAAVAFEEMLEIDEVKANAIEKTAFVSDWVGYEGEIGRHASQAYLEVEAASF